MLARVDEFSAPAHSGTVNESITACRSDELGPQDVNTNTNANTADATRVRNSTRRRRSLGLLWSRRGGRLSVRGGRLSSLGGAVVSLLQAAHTRAAVPSATATAFNGSRRIVDSYGGARGCEPLVDLVAVVGYPLGGQVIGVGAVFSLGHVGERDVQGREHHGLEEC